MAGSRVTGLRLDRAWGLLLRVVVGLLCVHGLVIGFTHVSSVYFHVNSVGFAEAKAVGDPVISESVQVKLGSQTITASVVRVKLRDPRVRVMVGLANDMVGATEGLLELARRKGAVAAINGTFFNAYEKGPVKDPVGTIITCGEVVHKGNTGTVFGITGDKKGMMAPVRFKIVGGIDGSEKWPNNWYSYFINRAPTSANSVIIYTPWRGMTTGVGDGISVVVKGGKVTFIGTGDQAIPDDGYVINFRGSETSLASRFHVGALVHYRLEIEDGTSASGIWADVTEGIGAGPRLVKDGRIVFSVESAKAEGFTEAKIFSQSNARSALGITESGELLMVTVPGAKMAELAEVMKSLGALEAMNLDGGASSGLAYRDEYITRPGRNISNALLVLVDDEQ
jgi:exopolysaccharide biosynthesis protein